MDIDELATQVRRRATWKLHDRRDRKIDPQVDQPAPPADRPERCRTKLCQDL
jgi:hypothetical protein